MKLATRQEVKHFQQYQNIKECFLLPYINPAYCKSIPDLKLSVTLILNYGQNMFQHS